MSPAAPPVPTPHQGPPVPSRRQRDSLWLCADWLRSRCPGWCCAAWACTGVPRLGQSAPITCHYNTLLGVGHPLQQRPVGCFSSLLMHNFQILGSALCQLREVPSQLTGAPQSNDWREVAGAQGLGCRGRNGARSKVPGGAAVRCAVRCAGSCWAGCCAYF